MYGTKCHSSSCNRKKGWLRYWPSISKLTTTTNDRSTLTHRPKPRESFTHARTHVACSLDHTDNWFCLRKNVTFSQNNFSSTMLYTTYVYGNLVKEKYEYKTKVHENPDKSLKHRPMYRRAKVPQFRFEWRPGSKT